MKKSLLTSLLLLITATTFAASQPQLTVNAIAVKGAIKLIISGTKNPNVSDTVNYPFQSVSAKVSNHTLYLEGLSRTAMKTVRVNLHDLKSLRVDGRVTIIGNNVHSTGLNLRANSTGNISLNGRMTVNKINNRGPNHITLRWVKSHNLTINSSAGRLTLAGSVQQMQVKLRNNAALDAQYLRAQRINVQTKGTAIAKVLPIYSLHAFATEHSQIYFYNAPKYISRYTRSSGNILQLGKRK